MKRFGQALMALGLLVGAGAGAWIFAGPRTAGLPLLVGIGLIKLTVVASLALIATGAALIRGHNRERWLNAQLPLPPGNQAQQPMNPRAAENQRNPRDAGR